MFRLSAENITHSNFPLLFSSLVVFYVGISLFDNANSDIITNLLITQVILAATYTLSKNGKIFIPAIIAGSLFISLRWLEFAVEGNKEVFQSLAILFMVGFMVLVFRNILAYLLLSKEINSNLILGVISGYLMLGVLFSFGFSLVEVLTDGQGINFKTENPEFKDIVYYTMITLTTIGYGDLSPVSDLSKLLSFSLGVMGQLYMGIVMAFIIGKFLQTDDSKNDESQGSSDQ
jgi:hypothetical protein